MCGCNEIVWQWIKGQVKGQGYLVWDRTRAVLEQHWDSLGSVFGQFQNSLRETLLGQSKASLTQNSLRTVLVSLRTVLDQNSTRLVQSYIRTVLKRPNLIREKANGFFKNTKSACHLTFAFMQAQKCKRKIIIVSVNILNNFIFTSTFVATYFCFIGLFFFSFSFFVD